jgi:uncharacterized YigZ family protein
MTPLGRCFVARAPHICCRRNLQTIVRLVEHEVDKIKGSRFIGIAAPIDTEKASKLLLQETATKYPGANHYCYAFKTQSTERSSDDGEPALTAGVPILRQLHFAELDNIMVIVVRYFGGTQLGKGGLSRAYGKTASVVLGKTEMVTHIPRSIVELMHSHELTGLVTKNIQQDPRIIVENAAYLGHGVQLRLSVPEDAVDALHRSLFLHQPAVQDQISFVIPSEDQCSG